MSSEPHDGKSAVEQEGFSYLPRFIGVQEAQELIEYFGSVTPLWEKRHRGRAHARPGQHEGLLTRPVYWLGAWQFASLGYYAEPHYRDARRRRLPLELQIERARLTRVGGGHHLEIDDMPFCQATQVR